MTDNATLHVWVSRETPAGWVPDALPAKRCAKCRALILVEDEKSHATWHRSRL